VYATSLSLSLGGILRRAHSTYLELEFGIGGREKKKNIVTPPPAPHNNPGFHGRIETRLPPLVSFPCPSFFLSLSLSKNLYANANAKKVE